LYPADPWKGSSHAMPFPVARGGAVVTWVTSTDAAAAVVFTPGERIPGYGALGGRGFGTNPGSLT
jgi:hypothetical protein